MKKQLYLGHKYVEKRSSEEKMFINTEDLLTHTFICGATGSGKTVLGKIIIEEAALAGIPAILIDLKGDLSSLAIPYTKLDRNDVEPWIDARNAEERSEKATQIIKTNKANMVRSELYPSDLQRFRRSISVRIYTPKSTMGLPLSLSPLSTPTFNVQEMFNEDRESFINLVGTVTDSLFERIFHENEREMMIEERTFLEELICYLWLKGVPLDGKKGISTLIKYVISPPMEQIGIMKPSDFLSDERRRLMARRLNRMLVGAESLWYEGTPINQILEGMAKFTEKTPITIFNLSHLDTFDERNLVVSQIAYSIYSWMRKKIDWAGPRLLFYIDEIGGGEKHAFYPDEPWTNASKSAINLLLRQGRAFGVCCVLSTQNPGDIDYRGLTNCQTWFIGKLLTEQDREKIIQGLMSVNFLIKSFEEFIKTADPGDFAVKLRGGGISHFKERWLLSFHKVITPDEFPFLRKTLTFDEAISETYQILQDKNVSKALTHIIGKIEELGQETNLLLTKGDMEVKSGLFDAAELSYNSALKLKKSDIGYLKLGKLQNQIGHLDQALDSFRLGLQINPQNEYLFLEMGEIYQTLKMFNQADEAYKQATRYNVNYEYAWNRRGWFLLNQNRPKDAEHSFDRALTINGKNPDSKTGMAVSYHMLGHTLKSLDILKEVINNNPKLAKPFYHKSQIHLELNELEEAVNCSSALIKLDRENSKAWVNHGIILLKSNHAKEAIPVLTKATQIAVNSSEAWDTLGLALRSTGDYDKSIAAATKAISLDETNPNYKYHLVEDYRHSQKTAEEVKLLHELNESFPKFIPAWIDLSWHLARDGEPESGVALIERALGHNPGNEELIFQKAQLAYLMADNENTINLLNSLQHLDKQNPEVVILKAKALADINDEMGSLSTYRDGCALFPEYFPLWMERCRLLLTMKRLRDAVECLDRATKLQPDSPEVWNARGDLHKASFEEKDAENCYAKAKELTAIANSGG